MRSTDRCTAYRLAWTLVALILGSGATYAEESQGADPEQKTSKVTQRHLRMLKMAEAFRVFASDQADETAKLLKEPVFRWANPQRDAVGGEVFLWTLKGRPHAAIGIWTYDDTAATDSYEVQSFASQPFRTSNPYRSWNPRDSGATFKPLPLAASPGKSKALRLVQMRQLGRKRFAAAIKPNGSGQRVELRFLPTPVYRYKELPPNVIDGAVFSFAQGTDPEVFLLLEARQMERSGKTQEKWYFAFGTQTSVEASASLDGKQHWTNRQLGDSFQFTVRRPTTLDSVRFPDEF